MRALSALLDLGAKQRVLRVTTAGTFTPTEAHLAKGGVVTITASGGGASGALHRTQSGNLQTRASGGNAGQRVVRTVALTGPVTYTPGAGGAARSATGTAFASLAGNDGGDTVVTGILTAKGGKGGYLSSADTVCRGGNGAAEMGASVSNGTAVVDARGGRGIDGCNGGGGGATLLVNAPIGTDATDGGGAGVAQQGVVNGATINGNNAETGTGAGGGGTAVATTAGTDSITVSSGAGAGGWLEFTWEE